MGSEMCIRDSLMAGLEEEKLEIFFEVIDTMNENLDAILEGEE